MSLTVTDPSISISNTQTIVVPSQSPIDMPKYIDTNLGVMLYARFVAILSRGDAY